jgi:hypothetical protein
MAAGIATPTRQPDTVAGNAVLSRRASGYRIGSRVSREESAHRAIEEYSPPQVRKLSGARQLKERPCVGPFGAPLSADQPTF